MEFLQTIRKLAHAYQSFEQVSDKNIRKIGLTPGQFDVLATLGNQPPMSCKDLAEKTLMVKGNLTVILDSLLKKGLINKSLNPNDARSTMVSLTKEGDKFFVDIFYQHMNYLQPLADSFNENDLRELSLELTNFTSRLDKFIDSINKK